MDYPKELKVIVQIFVPRLNERIPATKYQIETTIGRIERMAVRTKAVVIEPNKNILIIHGLKTKVITNRPITGISTKLPMTRQSVVFKSLFICGFYTHLPVE